MVVVLQLVVEACNAARAKSALGEGRGVCRSSERRDPPFFAGDPEIFGGLQKEVVDILVRLHRAVQVAVVHHEPLRVVDRVIGVEKGGNIVKLPLVGGGPGLGTAQSRLLGPGEDDSDLGVFKLDAVLVQLF